MRKVTIFLSAIIIAMNLYSQSREAVQSTFSFTDLENNLHTDEYLSGDSAYFQINNFLAGWHWGGERKISEVMHAQQNDMSTGWGISIHDTLYNDSTLLFIRSAWDSSPTGHLYSHCSYDQHVVFAKSLSYSAALNIDASDVYDFDTLANDPYNHIFGFKTKDENCTNEYRDGKWFLKVDKSQVDSGATILTDPWPNNLLSYDEGDNSFIDSNFSGRQYFLSINLRRLSDSDGFTNDTVLKIEVPYVYRIKIDSLYIDSLDSRKAYFSSIPDINGDTFNFNTYGYHWDLYDLPTGSEKQEIVITKNMLPAVSNDSGYITISGLIDFAGIRVNRLNYRLKEHSGLVGHEMIDTLNIKITYMGNCDLLINWVKFETPNTRKLLNGEYDDLIVSGIQRDLTNLTRDEPNFQFRSRSIKPSRFTINVESSAINWASERHFKKLVGNIISGAHGPQFADRYYYFINPSDKWIQTSAIRAPVTNPYCKNNFRTYKLIPTDSMYFDNWQLMGLLSGYKYQFPHFNESTKSWELNNMFDSEWETWIREGGQTTNPPSGSTYQHVQYARNAPNPYENSEILLFTYGAFSIQTYWEYVLNKVYINPGNGGFQFSETPWFSQCFVEEIMKARETDNGDTILTPYDVESKRLSTGPEFGLMTWTPIIMGAKGLIYDGPEDKSPRTIRAYDFYNWGNLRISPSEDTLVGRISSISSKQALRNMDDWDFVNHNQSTSDFLDTSYNHFYYNDQYPKKNKTIIEWNEQFDLHDYLGVKEGIILLPKN
jgi:hypothetical protein